MMVREAVHEGAIVTADERKTCVGCGAEAPETRTDFTLISARHGWRLVRRTSTGGDLVIEWRCPACWRQFKVASSGVHEVEREARVVLAGRVLVGRSRDFFRVLRMAYGDDEDKASRIVASALEEDGRQALPAAPEALALFAEARIQPLLQGELGPKLCAAIVRDLRRAAMGETPDPSDPREATMPTGERSDGGPVSTRRRRGKVLLVGEDLLRRASLARLLVQLGWDVRAVTPMEIAARVGQLVDAVIVDLSRADEVAYATAVRHFPSVPTVVRTPARTPPTEPRPPQAVLSADASNARVAEALNRVVASWPARTTEPTGGKLSRSG
jgi:CheY-like chemotaxis protein